MTDFLLVALVLVGPFVLLAVGRSSERTAQRPGLRMGIGGVVLLLVAGLSAFRGRWWLAGLFLVQAVIFSYEAWQRSREPR